MGVERAKGSRDDARQVDATSGLVYVGILGEGGDWEGHIPSKSREKSDVVRKKIGGGERWNSSEEVSRGIEKGGK